MLNRHARGLFTALLTPLARWLLRRGVTPDAVTVGGTAGTVAAALVLYPAGHLFWGTVAITVLVFADLLDGIMARLPEAPERGDGRWGSFLDSTLDRIADAAVFGGLAAWGFVAAGRDDVGIAALACLAAGSLVSYARAKAEALGLDANTGLAERAERLIVALVFAGLVGLGLPAGALSVALAVLAAASLVTVGQRIAAVRRQARA